MYCHNCGTKMDDGSAFCPECGARQEEMPDSTEAVNTESASIEDVWGSEDTYGEDQSDAGDFFPGDPQESYHKKGGKGLVIILILVVVVGVALGVGGFFLYRNASSPKSEKTVSDEKGAAKKEKTEKKSEDTKEGDSKKEKDQDKKEESGESLEGKAPENEERSVPAPVYEYQVIAQRMTWSEAKSYCESQGGRLATPSTQEEYNQVIQKAAESGLKVLWLGAQRTEDGSGFTWISGDTFSFSSWASGEPNNDQGVENRVGIMYVNGVWNMYDMPDDISPYYSANIAGFVMEKEVTQ